MDTVQEGASHRSCPGLRSAGGSVGKAPSSRLGGWGQVAGMSTSSGCLVGQRLAGRQHGGPFLITSTLVFCSKECLGFLGKCLWNSCQMPSHVKGGTKATVKLCATSSASAYRTQSSGTHGGSLCLCVSHEPQVLCSSGQDGSPERAGRLMYLLAFPLRACPGVQWHLLPCGLVTRLLSCPHQRTGCKWPALPYQSAFSPACRIPGWHFHSPPCAGGSHHKSIMLNPDWPAGPARHSRPGGTSQGSCKQIATPAMNLPLLLSPGRGGVGR